MSREAMSNLVSHSLQSGAFSAPGSCSRELSLSAWRRSPFGSYKKISPIEPLKTQKPPRSQALARTSARPNDGRLRRPEIFSNFDEQSIENGRNPAQSSLCGIAHRRAPEQPENKKISTSRLMQTLKITYRQRLTRGAVPVIPGEPRASAAREGDPRSAHP